MRGHRPPGCRSLAHFQRASLVLGLGAAGLSTAAHAQQDARGAATVSEVVVTAQKREENIQEVVSPDVV